MTLPIAIKRLFIQFIQAYFAENSYLRWNYDITKTKIVITDRNAFDIGVAVRRPSIVVTRGDLAWTFMIRNQDGINTLGKNFIDAAGSKATGAKYPRIALDLVRGSITFNVISKNGLQAENIADMIFSALTSYKKDLMAAGVQQFLNLSIGAEQTISQKSEIQLIGVPVNLAFYYRHSIITDERLYNIKILVNGEEWFEGNNSDFTIQANGTQIQFNNQLPSNADIKIYYVDAVTLENTETSLVQSDALLYTIPNGGAVLGFYNVNTAIQATVTKEVDNGDATINY
jgi:hypothetical protein